MQGNRSMGNFPACTTERVIIRSCQLREPDARKFNLGWEFPAEKKTGVLLVPASGLLHFMNQQIQVPRIVEITGKPSVEELRAGVEFRLMREQFRNSTAKYGYGTRNGKRDWKKLISKTRSF